jgi:hypothetical protein
MDDCRVMWWVVGVKERVGLIQFKTLGYGSIGRVR